MARTFLAAALASVLFAVPSFAADPASEALSEKATPARSALFSTAVASAPAAPLAASPTIVQNDWYKNTQRPSALPALYVGSAVLQAFDAYSTLRALNQGAVEANPLMKTTTGSPVVFIGVKAAATAASIFAAERMWRSHNRTGAIVTMVVSNGVMALVAQHNASVLSGLQR